jgi:aspartate aminotransferase
MELCEKIKKVQPSPTLAVTAKAAELKASGVDVISFGGGEPDFPTPAHIRQAAIDAINEGFTRYTAVPGIPELRAAVAEKFKRDNGLDYSVDQVMVNVGAKHSGYLVLQALLNPGDEVVVPAPYWVSYPPMVILAGGEPVIVNCREDDEFKLTPKDLEAAITPRTKALILNSPSNPIGCVYTADEIKALATICADAGVLVISDEIYETCIFSDGPEFVSTASLGEKIYENTVTINGVSKAYAMTGWRIGYMAGPQPLIAACSKLQGQSTSNPNSVAQKAALAALTGPQDEVAKMTASYEKRRDYIVKRLLEIDGVTCTPPKGAFYAFPNLSVFFGKKFGDKVIEGSVDLSAYLMEEAHVATVPGAAFGQDNCVRFSFVTAPDQIEKGMDRLAEALGNLS